MTDECLHAEEDQVPPADDLDHLVDLGGPLDDGGEADTGQKWPAELPYRGANAGGNAGALPPHAAEKGEEAVRSQREGKHQRQPAEGQERAKSQADILTRPTLRLHLLRQNASLSRVGYPPG